MLVFGVRRAVRWLGPRLFMGRPSMASVHPINDAVRDREASSPRRDSEPREIGKEPLLIASILRQEGPTGVQSYVNRLRESLAQLGVASTLVTPYSWGRPLTVPVFGVRLALRRLSTSASLLWYRYWHELFLHRALRRHLAAVGECCVYAQDPLAADAALRARRGAHQRVVMAVHLRTSHADEWADKKQIKRGGAVFNAIRRREQDVIPNLDGLVYVSQWARDALLSWLPEAAAVPSVFSPCLVTPVAVRPQYERLGDLVTVGALEYVKNHRFLLEVLAEARAAGRSYTLDVYGDGHLRRDLVQLARALGLETQVRFQGFRPDVQSVLPRYRAYVHASYSESFCLAIVEAMAAGLPIVTADIGPIGELCDDGVEARYWPLDDPRRAAERLIDLLACENVRLETARAARQRFLRQFDPDRVVPDLLRFFRELTPTRGGARTLTDNAADARAGGPAARRGHQQRRQVPDPAGP